MTKVEVNPNVGVEVPSALKIAVLISNKGRGSNLNAIVEASKRGKLPGVNLGLVVSDKDDALGLNIARMHEIPEEVRPFYRKQYADDGAFAAGRDEYGTTLAFMLNREGVQIAVMAGFMTVLPQVYLDVFKGVTINIHPGFVPDNPDVPITYLDGITRIPWNKGLMAEKAVENFVGKPRAFSTIHIVTSDPDFGPVLERAWVEVGKDETTSQIYDRLKRAEHVALIAALNGHKLREHLKAKK